MRRKPRRRRPRRRLHRSGSCGAPHRSSRSPLFAAPRRALGQNIGHPGARRPGGDIRHYHRVRLPAHGLGRGRRFRQGRNARHGGCHFRPPKRTTACAPITDPPALRGRLKQRAGSLRRFRDRPACPSRFPDGPFPGQRQFQTMDQYTLYYKTKRGLSDEAFAASSKAGCLCLHGIPASTVTPSPASVPSAASRWQATMMRRLPMSKKPRVMA